jgi:hypothetical protein
VCRAHSTLPVTGSGQLVEIAGPRVLAPCLLLGTDMGPRLVIGVLVALSAPAAASPLTPSSAESAALGTLAGKIPGAKVLWVRGNKIYLATAASGFTTQLVTQGNIVETNPRFSPDGTQVLTVRSDGVYLMKSDFSGATKVIPGGHTASWTRDGKAITAIDSTGYKAVQVDLATKTVTTIYDAQVSPYNGQKLDQAAELRAGGRFLLVFRLTPVHTTEVVDLQLKKYISNQEMARGDCSPSWAPDGSYFLTTARTTSRPVLKTAFSVGTSGGSVSASTYFVGLDTSEKFYIHGQRVSNDGKYIAFGGKIFAGTLASAMREIYIWRIGEPDANAVRVTFDTAEDESPDLFIPAPGTQPKLALSPTAVSFTATEGGSDPSAKTVSVSNAGGGTLAGVSTQVTYGTGSGWLTVKASGSGNSQTLANSAAIAGLQPNTYTATVKVSSSGASNSPQSYTVSLTVQPAQQPPGDEPLLALSPSSLSFTAQQGSASPAEQSVAVSNGGKGTLATVSATVTYVSGSDWLTVTPGGSDNSQTLDNSVTAAGLAPDTYSATVKVEASGATNSPQSYAVSLTVTEAPVEAGPPVGADGGSGSDLGAPVAEGGAPGGDASGAALTGGSLSGGCSLAPTDRGPGALALLGLLLGLGLVWRARRRR